MGALAAVERFLERLFEGQSARLFRTRLRPIQVQRRIERAMESGRVRDGQRTIVPHRLVVRVAPDDLIALRNATPGLAASLADAALAFARSHSYTVLDRPTITLRPDARVVPGDVVVDVAAAPPTDVAAHELDGGPSAAGADDRRGAPPDALDEPTAAPERRFAPEATAVFAIPAPEGPRATLREIRADRTTRTVEIDGRPLTIGRAPDNALVVGDGRASRHHARIDLRRGSLVLTDLGSTNGSWVNDRRVESVALGVGDRIRIGATTLVVESLDEGRERTAGSDDERAGPRRTREGPVSPDDAARAG